MNIKHDEVKLKETDGKREFNGDIPRKNSETDIRYAHMNAH